MKKVGSRLFIIFLFYALFVTCTEWINLFSYFSEINLPFGTAEIVSVILLLLLFRLIRNKLDFEPLRFNFEKTIGSLIIIGIGFFMSVFPDRAYDTGNYHLIAQNPAFENYFTEDYAYGSFQVWGFRLADRMFYYFRYLLGYRLGTFLNVFIMFLAFTQLYDILDWILSKYNSEKSIGSRIVCNRLVWSLAILFSLDAILMFGIYYVDLFAIPLTLEIIRLFLKDSGEQRSIDIYYFAILNGICLGFKLTNIIYVIPMVLIYIVRNYKSMRFKQWVWAILIGLFPFADYLVFNFICTGNPVFPYFNGLFKSPFFLLSNWKDTRWGPSSFFEKIFWIIYAAFNPRYRQCEISNIKPAVLIIGLASVLIRCFITIDNKKHSEPIEEKHYSSMRFFTITTVVSTFLWSLTTGYSRYFIFGFMLWGILAYSFLADISAHYDALGRAVSIGCSIAVVVCAYANLLFVLNGTNWSWHIYTIDNFQNQLGKIFTDRDITKDYGISPDMFVITSQEYMGIAELINNNVYTVNTNSEAWMGNNYQSAYKERMKSAKVMYDIHLNTFNTVADYVETLNSNTLYITDVMPILVGAGDYYLVNVECADSSDMLNTLWISNDEPLELGLDTEHIKTLSFIGGRYYNWEMSPQVLLQISEVDENGHQNNLVSIPIDNQKVQKYEIQLSGASNRIIINACYADGTPISGNEINQVFMMNWTLE